MWELLWTVKSVKPLYNPESQQETDGSVRKGSLEESLYTKGSSQSCGYRGTARDGAVTLGWWWQVGVRRTQGHLEGSTGPELKDLAR